MPTKKKRIRELHQENPSMTSADIAEEVDTSPQYVREVWNDSPDGGGEEVDAGDPLDGLNQAHADAAAEGEDTNPLSELVVADDWGAYECGECGAEVEYLQDECGDCGEPLAWWDA